MDVRQSLDEWRKRDPRLELEHDVYASDSNSKEAAMLFSELKKKSGKSPATEERKCTCGGH